MDTFEEDLRRAMAASLVSETERKNSESDFASAVEMSKSTAIQEFIKAEAEAKAAAEAKATMEAKAVVNSCFVCHCRANHCEHWCTSCFIENLFTSCPMCVLAKADAKEDVKETRGMVVVSPLGPTGYGEVMVYCPGCDVGQKLYYKVRENKRQLVDGAGQGTCHTMMCNCAEKSTSMSGVHASMLEDFLLSGNRDDYFGEGSTQVSGSVEMRQYLQKDQPHSSFRKGDQFPQHLTPLACDMLNVTLTNYGIVLGDVGDVPYTKIHSITQ